MAAISRAPQDAAKHAAPAARMAAISRAPQDAAKHAAPAAGSSAKNAAQQEGELTQAVLTADLNCRTRLSARPDAGYERLLGASDSLLGGEELVRALKSRGRSVSTVVNPGSARACFELRDKGHEVIPAALFRCPLGDHPRPARVIVYGLEPGDDEALERLSGNLEPFLDRVRERDQVAVLSRPFEIEEGEAAPPREWYERAALCFDTVEALYGGSDLWQCLLALRWVQSLTPQRLDDLSRRTGIAVGRFCRRPHARSMTGGSGDRSGLLAGTVWTEAHGAAEGAPSARFLDSLRDGRVCPDGHLTQEETHGAVLLARLCELAIHFNDPGLAGTLLSDESAFDRAVALALANLFGELGRHRFTSVFLKGLLGAFHGKRPSPLLRRLAPRAYRGHLEAVDRLALSRRHDPSRFHHALAAALPELVEATDALLGKKIHKSLDRMARRAGRKPAPEGRDFLEGLDIPAQLRPLLSGLENPVNPAAAVRRMRRRAGSGLGKALDDFSFPAISSVFFGALSFGASRNLTRQRAAHAALARAWGLALPPRRVLWLTDTFHDHNGVSRFLTSLHGEAAARGLPIDFLICSSTRGPEPQLLVLRPYCEFHLEKYQDQLIRLPSLIQAHRLFAEGGYDCVVSSTEFPMGAVALYFKYAFHVPAWLYMHTDWLDFARKTLRLGPASMTKAESFFRFLYRRFDGIFALNREHEAWLTGPGMGHARVRRTAHWAEPTFRPGPDRRRELLGVGSGTRVLLFAGRISDEKGVFDLPAVWERVRKSIPDTALVLAGTGPAVERLEAACPGARFLGWVDPGKLAEIYASADLLLMPSRFDTFGCVVLEALSCALPVVAYDSKGPGDIIEDGKCGYLVEDREGMARACAQYLEDRAVEAGMKKAALERSRQFSADAIIRKLMADLGLETPNAPSPGAPRVEKSPGAG